EEGPELPHPQIVKMNALLSGKADCIAYTSHASMAHHAALGFAKARSVYIPSGIDTRRFAPRPDARAHLRNRLGLPHETPIIGLVQPMRVVHDPYMFFNA